MTPVNTAFLEAMLHTKRLRTGISSMNGCIALDAIAEAVTALRRAAPEISPAYFGLECIADQLHDMASDVAGYYADPELTPVDLRDIRLDERSKAMREDAA